ncbi:patatin-like phospholipase family protein [Flavobacterium sp. MAH-1]|uniref:Patatin-like phospholipase family protein n=1 Tax=Flavobacterium agri TaxID=2743471 RepID=A0A7Y8XZE0_9FLAO|nr:patatin-like phospholipase family protein [Flavobacterium agri]NUY79736.1 patatin-like phospholipase family protein [Flavobacterium agri]NYA69761.1 patatin-like phospholipase family protein [Flavobacterium agri]
MRALVISGGGSKGAFAGGVAQYLMEVKGHKYDLLLGTSTGSLLIPHLALGKVEKIHGIYTNVTMDKIFNVNPFIVKKRDGVETVAINHFNVIWQFLRGRKTFGESKKLRKYIRKSFTRAEFEELKHSACNIVVTVTNLSKNECEYKCIKDFSYDQFCDWIWISCNYVPFMSLVKKGKSVYGDGGFSALVPIREAIQRGATEVDVVVLETETLTSPRAVGKNPFSLMVDLFGTLLDQVEKHDITIGKLSAKNNNVKLNIFYTPTSLTTNALVFNKDAMKKWWEQGYEYAQNKSEIMSEVKEL